MGSSGPRQLYVPFLFEVSREDALVRASLSNMKCGEVVKALGWGSEGCWFDSDKDSVGI